MFIQLAYTKQGGTARTLEDRIHIHKYHNTEKNHLEEGKNAIETSVMQFPLSVITDYTWTGWELASETTFQEKGLKWMNKSQ